MTVLSILNEKGTDVCTVQAGQKVSDIAQTLRQRKIGAVVVVGPSGDVIGVISERDLVRAVAEGGAGALDHPARDYMTTEVATCVRSDPVDHVMEKMTAGRFRHMPVVENGKLCGIISIGDVVKRRIEDTEREARDLREYIATG